MVIKDNRFKIVKFKYSSPEITHIEIDNEISLVLDSDPPTYEQLSGGKEADFLKTDPLKNIYV